MLDIDKVRADIPRDPGRGDVTRDESLDLVVGEHLRVAGHMEPPVQDRMSIRHTGLHAELVGGLAKAARVRELKADHQVVGAAITLPVGADQEFPQLGQVPLVLLDYDELVLSFRVVDEGHLSCLMRAVRFGRDVSSGAA